MDYDLPEEFFKQFELLKIEFSKKLPAIILELEESMYDFNCESSSQNLKNLYIRVHNLAGSSGLYGYSNITNISREFEQYIKPFIEEEKIISENILLISEIFEKYICDIKKCINN